jgi:hypothetical protein
MKRLVVVLTISILLLSTYACGIQSFAMITASTDDMYSMSIGIYYPYNITINNNSFPLIFHVFSPHDYLNDNYSQTHTIRKTFYSLDEQPNVPVTLVVPEPESLRVTEGPIPHTEYSGTANITQLSDGEHNIKVFAEYIFPDHTETANQSVYFYVNTTLITSPSSTVPEFPIFVTLPVFIAMLSVVLIIRKVKKV